MSGIGGWEVLILVMIGLVVLGPKRLPQVANQLGSWIGQARRMTRAMKRQLEDELNLDEQFKPRQPGIAPPASTSDAMDPVNDLDLGSEAHVPNDDDSYSPLHGDEEEAPDAETDSKS